MVTVLTPLGRSKFIVIRPFSRIRTACLPTLWSSSVLPIMASLKRHSPLLNLTVAFSYEPFLSPSKSSLTVLGTLEAQKLREKIPSIAKATGKWLIERIDDWVRFPDGEYRTFTVFFLPGVNARSQY